MSGYTKVDENKEKHEEAVFQFSVQKKRLIFSAISYTIMFSIFGFIVWKFNLELGWVDFAVVCVGILITLKELYSLLYFNNKVSKTKIEYMQSKF